MIVGITGYSGSGKSTVSKVFGEKGFFVADTDKIGHDILMPDGKAYREIVNHFGESILNPDKTINRKALGTIVFNNNEELLFLNKVTHFYITEIVKELIKAHKNIVIDGALLIESKINLICDKTIFVSCPIDIRIDRIIKRDNISENEVYLRLNSQKDDAFYKENCDFEIVNDGLKDILPQVEEFLS